jgi:MFS transporter, UMF1 family
MKKWREAGGMREFFETARGQRIAWYLYDFGNSAYAAVVLLAVYSAYFKDGVVGGAEGSRLWGIAVGIAMLVVALISPILGAIADRLAIKKKMLGAFTAMACCFTASLFFVTRGDILAGMLLFILAEIGYRAAQVYYNAMLPEIASRSELGRVSGNGWAIGSLGGIICLAIVLPLVVVIGGNLVLRLTMVITAIFFAVSTLPLFFYVRESGQSKPLAYGESILTLGFKRLWQTMQRAREYSEYLKFLVAFIFFNDAVMIALNFAAIIGAVLYGFEREQLIVLIILVQMTNVAGAWIFGQLTDHVHAKGALLWSMGVMAVAVIWILMNDDPAMYYFIGALAGFAMAGLQAVSRTMVAKLVPSAQAAEFYGLFAVAGRSSSVIGPALFGWVAAESAVAYLREGMTPLAAEQAGMHLAIYLILGFLVVGALILLFVREEAVTFAEAKPATG